MKKTALAMIAGVAFGLGASVAVAGPTDSFHTKKRVPKVKAVHQELPQQDDFTEDFEAYDVGSDIVGQGGWEVWYTGGEHAVISDDQSRSGKHSMQIHPASDIVHRFTAEDGQWTFSLQTYIPSTSTGDGYIIMMNQYESPTDNWSIQIRMNPDEGIVESQADFNTTTLVEDAWAEVRCEIDLDADTLNIYYDGVLFAADLIFSQNVSGGGITSIANTDLYSASIDVMYFDDVTLKAAGGGCAPDLDGSGSLDLFDFLKFVNLFNAKDPVGDWDGDGDFTLFDFLGFVNDFNAGC